MEQVCQGPPSSRNLARVPRGDKQGSVRQSESAICAKASRAATRKPPGRSGDGQSRDPKSIPMLRDPANPKICKENIRALWQEKSD